MTVCRNWDGSPGSCRFGDRCRYEHPPPDRGFASSNPFAPLQRDNSNTRNGNGYQAGASTARALPFQLDKNQIVTDLSTERPQWILSAYGPGRNAPEQLFGGSVREQSFEEIHLLHRIAERSGNIQQAAQEAQNLVQQSEQQIQTALNSIDGAIDYIINAEKTHPNRIDIVKSSNTGAPQNTNAFGYGNNSSALQAVPPASNAFGAPSQLAATTSFGAPSVKATSGAFGQPSALGTKTSAFRAPSQAFGGVSQLGAGGGAFGQPSALGQKSNPFGAPTGFSSFAKPGNAFGQPSQPAATSTFGTPSQPAPSNPFGAPSQPATSGAFGAPSQPAPTNPFEATSQPAPANPFGGTSAPFGALSPAPKSVFGGPSGQTPATAPFGAPSPAPKNPFGAPSQPAPNPFGGTSAPTPNPFASAPPVAANPFGNPQPQRSVPSAPFGATSNGTNPTNLNPFGNRPQAAAAAPPAYQPVAFTDTGRHPPLNSYATVQANGRLTMFKGRQVVYRQGEPGFKRNDGSWEKIWFPEGAPPFYGDTEMEDAAYDGQTKAAYTHLRQTGAFEGGVMPMLPPKREWCLWDF